MLNCPYCQFPLVGKTPSKLTQDTSEVRIACSNCEAILRVEITTLKEPNSERLKKHINKTKPATTYCSLCSESIGLDEKHKCAVGKVVEDART